MKAIKRDSAKNKVSASRLRVEPLEEREMLSVNFPMPFVSSQTALISSDSHITDVVDEIIELRENQNEVESSGFSEFDHRQETSPPEIIADIFAVYSSEDFELYRDDDGGDVPRSGGSSGGNGLISQHSGGGIEYGDVWLLSEGETVVISIQGGDYGDVVTASIGYGATCADDFSGFINQAVIGGNPCISLTVVQDMIQNEADESFTINLAVTSGNSTLSRTSFSFIIVEKPEFISDTECPDVPTYGDDYFRACISETADEGTPLTYRYDHIGAYGNNLYFSFANASNPEIDPSGCFRINSASGAITLARHARDIVATTNGDYHYTLTVKVENNNYSHMSGGNAFYDLATVSVTISHWEVNRNGEAKAAAQPNDGCSIGMLARALGLLSSESDDWLTIPVQNPDGSYVYVELFNGEYRRVDELTPADLLAASNINNGIFSVPNTIFAAYCYNPMYMGTFIRDNELVGIDWSARIAEFNSLGFRVETFINSSLSGNNIPTGLEKKTTFLNSVSSLATSKSLHGLYIVSHGNQNGFVIPNMHPNATVNNDNNCGWGAYWNIDYTHNNGASFGSGNTSNNDSDWTVDGALRYHLAAIIVHACNAGFNGLSLCSNSFDENSGGFAVGLPGVVFPLPYQWDVYWNLNLGYDDGYSHGGKQRTRRY